MAQAALSALDAGHAPAEAFATERARPPGEVVPRHVAIIMDGNGRWAAARKMPRVEGHRRGVEAVRRAVRAAGEAGIEILTLYSFSAENWRRPASEIADLFSLLRRFIRNDLAELHANGVRVTVVGERESLEPDIQALIAEAEALTGGNAGLRLVVAFNYGGRQEIVRAAQRIAADVAAGRLAAADVDERLLEARLDTAGLPDPDLVIRTSGEQRVSNFLLWQAAYAEFVFLPVLWPDFNRESLDAALAEYRARDRRFGGLSTHAG